MNGSDDLLWSRDGYYTFTTNSTAQVQWVTLNISNASTFNFVPQNVSFDISNPVVVVNISSFLVVTVCTQGSNLTEVTVKI